MKTFELIISELKNLNQSGFVKTYSVGSDGIEKTLKNKLGIKDVELQGPNGEHIDIYVSKKNSSKMLILFAKSPLPKKIYSKLREEYGYPDKKYPDKLILRTTIDSIKFNTIKNQEGFMILGKGNKIEIQMKNFMNKKSNIPNPYWPKEDFENSIKNKFKKTFLYVKAESRGRGINEEFHFNEAYLLQEFDFLKFAKNLKKGILEVEIKLGLHLNGNFHNRGTSVKINPSLLHECFSSTKII